MQGDGIVHRDQAVPLCFGGFKESYVLVAGRTLDLNINGCVVVGPRGRINYFCLSHTVAVGDKVVYLATPAGFGKCEGGWGGCCNDIDPDSRLVKRMGIGLGVKHSATCEVVGRCHCGEGRNGKKDRDRHDLK